MLAFSALAMSFSMAFGVGHRRKAVEHFALAVHQKLGEVPLDVVAEQSAGLGLQVLVERMLALAVDLDLGKQRER